MKKVYIFTICKLPRFGAEALLHCAIVSATCLTMLLGTKNEKCAHASLKLRDKLLEG